MTSPNFPVICILPFPGITADSIFKISPPTSVHANPVTTPTLFSSSISPYLNFSTPKRSLRSFSFIGLLTFSLLSIFFTSFLPILEISLSKFLTPDSLCVMSYDFSINIFINSPFIFFQTIILTLIRY